jgi:phosphoserine phosphatase RsbU/P
MSIYDRQAATSRWYSATVSKTTAPQMGCMDVWSGSHFTQRGVEFGGLDAWLYSKPYGEARRGGDVFYASSCATGRITRLLLADVSGHGSSVAAAAADLRVLMRRFVNCLDQTEFVRSINHHFSELSKQTVFATAIVTTFFSPTRVLTVCNAGHPRPLIYRAARRQWEYLSQVESVKPPGVRNLPLGILSISDYDQFDVELQIGDCVVTYTDALIESQDADDKRLGEDGLLRIMKLLGDIDPPRLIGTLLAEIADRYPENLSRDDVSVVVLRVSQRKPHYTIGEKAKAMIRFAGTLIRAVDPRSERAPFPDLNVPNIGGAVIPALGRGWRGSTANPAKPASPTKS